MIGRGDLIVLDQGQALEKVLKGIAEMSSPVDVELQDLQVFLLTA